MWRWVYGSFFVASIFVSTHAANQCSLGHKVYSVENGNNVCAPLAPFQCVHSCQWNSSCANTAHSHAFHGRRTFVAGMILTTDNFLLLCCATFANVVQQNQKLENRCVWAPPTNTVENGPSVRFDPPLNANEYVRDVQMKRLERGRVEVRAQICKFITQRTNCDEATIPQEDKQPYSLLQLRLSRAEAFLEAHNGTDSRQLFLLPDVPGQDQFRDEVSVSTTPEIRGLGGGFRLTSSPARRSTAAPQAPPSQQIRSDLPLRQFTPNGGANSIFSGSGFRQFVQPNTHGQDQTRNSNQSMSTAQHDLRSSMFPSVLRHQ